MSSTVITSATFSFVVVLLVILQKTQPTDSSIPAYTAFERCYNSYDGEETLSAKSSESSNYVQPVCGCFKMVFQNNLTDCENLTEVLLKGQVDMQSTYLPGFECVNCRKTSKYSTCSKIAFDKVCKKQRYYLNMGTYYCLCSCGRNGTFDLDQGLFRCEDMCNRAVQCNATRLDENHELCSSHSIYFNLSAFIIIGSIALVIFLCKTFRKKILRVINGIRSCCRSVCTFFQRSDASERPMECQDAIIRRPPIGDVQFLSNQEQSDSLLKPANQDSLAPPPCYEEAIKM